MFNRRKFIQFGILSLTLGSIATSLTKFKPRFARKGTGWPGKMKGPNVTHGHRLRFGKFQPAEYNEYMETVIIGGGISGLSAGWWLKKNGHSKFQILELEKEVGGNSRSGANEVSAYPWGAHYLPLPSSDSVYVKEFLTELGVIKGTENGLPVYDEYYLCADPHERIFFQGRWHDGLLPQTGISEDDRRQYQEFFTFMKLMAEMKGRDGKTAFAIPLEESSRDEEFRKFDARSMNQLMDEKGWNAKTLRWYVNYCMRDDYGLTSENVSAWAGIHYFASRSGKAANAGKETVLTWPEGNGWLVKQLSRKLEGNIRNDCLVHKITKDGDHFLIDFVTTGYREFRVRYRAKNVIYAAPRYTAKFVLDPSLGELPLPQTKFAPWMVANVTLKHLPEGKGQDLSWDNVSYYSQSLGYIVATHQNLDRTPGKSVITYYLPLTAEDADVARRHAFAKDHQYWADYVATDLENIHSGIKDEILNIDICVWGHGMVGPVPGYLWGDNRKRMQESVGGIHFAHTDMSGISIFEEAQYRGIMAAKKVLG